MPRVFVAIDLPQNIKDKLLELQRDDIPTARWSSYDQLHLTLHFIGEIPDAVANAYREILKTVDVPAFEMSIAGVGQFPVEDRPRVMWAGVDNTPELRALHEAVGSALEEEGFQREKRRYHPHITLMRFRKPIRRGVASSWIQEHMDLYIEPFPITAFSFYESVLQSGGSVYQKLETYTLKS